MELYSVLCPGLNVPMLSGHRPDKRGPTGSGRERDLVMESGTLKLVGSPYDHHSATEQAHDI